MLIKTKYIDCASKSVFNTWKLPTSAADTSGDIYWSAVVYIKDTGEVWTHGKLYGGFFSNADNNKVSLTIGGTTKILALDGHVQSYTTLTGSGSTADQAILSTGVANKWTLKTLGKNAFSNVDYLPADANAVAAEKVVNALAFQYNGKTIHSFDGSVARVLNIIQGDNVVITGDSQGNVTIAADPGSDTVNTAGATNKVDAKLFLIGAESQTTAPQTYSNQYVYIGTDNCLYSLGKKVLTEHQAIYNLDLQTQVGEAITKVTTFDPNAANNSFTLVQGTNVTLTNDATNKKVTISSKDTTYDFYNIVFKQGESIIDTYKPTTSPNKTLKAGTNVTFTGSNDEILITTQDTRNTAGATEKLATKLFLAGALTQTDNPQTYTNSKVYVDTDNKLHSDGKAVSTEDHTHNYAGATSPGSPALKVDLNPSGLLDATYGSYGGILQDLNKGPESGSWSNRIKILYNNSTGYYTELAQAMTGTAGLWHRRNEAGVVSEWTPVIDNVNFHTYLDDTYVIRGNNPNVLTNYVRYSINTGLTMNWEWGDVTPTHIWGSKGGDNSNAYVFNGDNIRAFANAVSKSGDTMYGPLKIQNSNTGATAQLLIDGSNESLTFINVAVSGESRTRLGWHSTNGSFIYNGLSSKYLGIRDDGTPYFNSYTLWHTGNLVGLITEHSHNTINHIDNRNVASTPQEHPAGVWFDFKTNANANLSDGGSYAGLLTVRKYGNTADWSGGKAAQLGFTDNSNIWVRFGTGTSWEAWKQLATTVWADGKFLPLAGGKMTSGARISHDGNLYIGNSDNAGWIALQNMCSQDSIGDGIWSIRTNGNAIFTTIKKVGSSDSYVLLGGGGHKALEQFVYATGSLGVQESTGTSDSISRAQFWRDNNLAAYGVTLSHSTNTGYKTKIYHDYNNGSNLYMKACSNGTWGSVYTIWNSGNFDPNTKVNKAGDTMTGTLKVTEIQTTGGNGLTMYSGTDWTYLGQQAGTTYIRSGATDIYHRKNGTDYKIWDANNDGSGSGLDADLLDGVQLIQKGDNNGVLRSWARGSYTTVNQYFGNGVVVVIDPKPTDSNELWANTAIFSIGDSAIRNWQVAYGYGTDTIKARRISDGPTYNAWKTFAFLDSNVASATRADYPTGFTSKISYAPWGNQDGTLVTGWSGPSSADIQFRNNGGQLNVIIDGSFYQNEGKYKVLDTNNYSSTLDARYVAKTGDTMTGNLQVGQVVIGNTNEVNATDSGNVLYLGYRNTPGGVNICYNNAPLTYGSAKYTIYHSGNISSVLNKRRVPGEVVDFYVYQVNGYTCTSYNYSTFKSQLFESDGRGKTSVTYRPSSNSTTTYTVDLSDFVLCVGWVSGFYSGMYTAAAGATEDCDGRVGASVGSNSKSITGYQMPRHTHWFANHRGDDANDRDHFGPESNNGDSPDGIQSAGKGGNWHTGYSGRGDAIDFRPRTFMVFKIMYMPKSY